jgi:phosphate transport system protein
MATVKVISDLERIGDEATKIARSVGHIASCDLLAPDHYHVVINMSHTVKHMMHEALDAYTRMDTAKVIERIGEHATNIAEFIIYVMDGKDVRHTDYRLLADSTLR